jgi:hypothetical protein
MIAIESSRTRAPSIENALRAALSNPRTKAQTRDELSMDDSQVSRFLSGQAGITIDKLDAMVKALGMVVTSRQYMDALAFMAQTGTACECARAGMGECGRK